MPGPQKLMSLVQSIQQGGAQGGSMSGKPGIDPNLAAETISKYNEYGQHFQSAMTMGELAERLMAVAEYAESAVMSEADDWYDGHTIQRNMKEMKGYVKEFSKVAQEHDGLRQRMSALYDDMGRVLERYFELHGDQGPEGEEKINDIAYDTGEDEIEIGNSNKVPVPDDHAAQMGHMGQTTNSDGFQKGGDIDNAPHNMDDPHLGVDDEDEVDYRKIHEDDEDGDAPDFNDGSNQNFRRRTKNFDRDSDHELYSDERDSSDDEMNEEDTAGLERAKNLTERMVRLAREHLKGDQLVRFDTLPRKKQILVAWRVIR